MKTEGKEREERAKIESVPPSFISISKRLATLETLLSLSIYLSPPIIPFPTASPTRRRGCCCCFTLFDFFKIYPCRFLAKSLSGRNLRSGNNTLECGREEEGREERRANGKGTHHSRHVRSLLPPLLYLTACLLLRFLYDHPLISCTGPRLGPNSFQFVRIRCCHFFYGTLERVDRYKEMKRLTFDELVIVRWKERKV